jgi:hypothetical protein
MQTISAKELKKKFPQSANALTASIVRHINSAGGFATRINTQGQWDPTRKIMRTGHTTKGMSDIVAVYKGEALFIEVKIGRDRLSQDQIVVSGRVVAAGGRYFIARDYDEFKVWFDSLQS